MTFILKNLHLKTKFILILISGILIISLTSITATFYLIHNYNQLLYTKSADSLAVAIHNISTSLQSAADLSTTIATDHVIQENLTVLNTDSEPLKKKNAISQLSRMLTYYNSIHPSVICIRLDYGESSVIAGRRTITESPESKESIREAAFTADGRPFFIGSQSEQAGLACTKLVKKSSDFDLSPLGTLTIYLDVPSILQSGQKLISVGNETNIYLFLNDSLLSETSDNLTLAFPDNVSRKTDYTISTINGTKYFIVQKALSTLPFVCIMVTDYNSIFQALIRTNAVFAVAVVSITLLVIAASNLLLKNLLKHISLLLLKINHYKKDTTDYLDVHYDYSQRTDEIGILHNEFDDMIQKINALINDNYVKQLLIKDAQLKALEQQINPHFLYNTLNIINWEAQALEAPSIPTIIDSLSYLLRNILSEKSVEIPLKKELDILNHYITIQKFRFSDRLLFSTNIPQAMMTVSVPKMSVQPLVENAIKYALEPNPGPCTITVSSHSGGGQAVITVSNTGSVIDSDILEQLHSGLRQTQGFGIGLTNIDSRIRLLYGNEYGLKFAQSGDRTDVIMTLPLNKKYVNQGE